MKYRKKISMFILAILTFIMFDNVYAENVNIDTGGFICNNGYTYQISNYEIDGETFFDKLGLNGFNLVTTDFNVHVYNDGNGTRFNYKLSSGSNSCYNSVRGTKDDYNFMPHNCNEKYINSISIDNNKTDKEQILNVNNGTITIKLSVTGNLAKEFDRIRVVTSYADGSAGTVTKDKSNKKIIISGITPSRTKNNKYTIMVYLDDVKESDFFNNSVDARAICNQNNSLNITYLDTEIRNDSSFDITVPESYRNGTICTNIKNYEYASEEFKQKYIPECYNENLTMTYDEYEKLASETQEKYNVLRAAYPKLDPSPTIDQKDLKCTNIDLGITSTDNETKPFDERVTFEKNGNYWGIRCVEKYYVEADSPKLVRAGEGVDYANKVEIQRTCSIINIHQVVKRPQCSFIASIGCDHGDGNFGQNAGPNATFDSCVKECDNGKYSKSCVNSCYDKVYNNKTDNSIFGLKNSFSDYVATKVSANGYIDNSTTKYFSPDSSGRVEIGNGYYVIVGPLVSQWNPYYPTGNHVAYGVSRNVDLYGPGGFVAGANASAGCSTSANTCRVSLQQVPSGCSWNPQADYDNEINASKAEYSSFVEVLKSKQYYSPINDYTISFVDTKDGQTYKVSGSTLENRTGVVLDIKVNDDLTKLLPVQSGDITPSITIGNQGTTMSNVQTTFRNLMVYDINLPTQYTLKGDANTILINGTDGFYEKVNDGKGTYKFSKYKVDNKNALSNGEMCYYTALESMDFNREVECEKVNNKKINDAATNPNTLLGKISKIIELKDALGNVTNRTTFQEYWSENADYLTSYSYNAFVAYVQKENLIVKSLVEEMDNIEVTMKIGTIGDAYRTTSAKITKHPDASYKCYYGVYNMLNSTGEGCDEQKGLRYYYHEVNLEDMFDDSAKRDPRWNWTGTITGDEVTGAARKVNSNYIVDPERLIESIESKGNKIYTDKQTQDREMDYSYTLDYATIRKIREYNNTRVNGKKISYTDFSLAVANNTQAENYSTKVKDWLGTSFTNNSLSISACNNAIGGACYNYNIGGR